MKKYKVQKHLNKTIKFAGFTSVQFGVISFSFFIILVILNMIFLNNAITIVFIVSYISGTYYISKKLRQEKFDYIISIQVKSGTPKYITDKKRCFKYLVNQD